MKTPQELMRFSKTISYALRHHPEDFGLELDSDGSVAVSELLKGISEKKGQTYTEEDLKASLEIPGKKRFVIEGSRIRAYYVHSIKKEVIRPEIEPPELLFHATSRKALPSILEQGLSPMSRQHVHLASTKKTALDAGLRRDPFPPPAGCKIPRGMEGRHKVFSGQRGHIPFRPHSAGIHHCMSAA